MNKTWFLVGLALLLSACAAPQNGTPATREEAPPYTAVSPATLQKMLAGPDITLVDVHIPEQPHIPGTDAVIPYNDIDALEAALPDKNAKIVLYCRSGGMSELAAAELAKRGYTNLSILAGGENAWRAAGYGVVENER